MSLPWPPRLNASDPSPPAMLSLLRRNRALRQIVLREEEMEEERPDAALAARLLARMQRLRGAPPTLPYFVLPPPPVAAVPPAMTLARLHTSLMESFVSAASGADFKEAYLEKSLDFLLGGSRHDASLLETEQQRKEHEELLRSLRRSALLVLKNTVEGNTSGTDSPLKTLVEMSCYMATTERNPMFLVHALEMLQSHGGQAYEKRLSEEGGTGGGAAAGGAQCPPPPPQSPPLCPRTPLATTQGPRRSQSWRSS